MVSAILFFIVALLKKVFDFLNYSLTLFYSVGNHLHGFVAHHAVERNDDLVLQVTDEIFLGTGNNIVAVDKCVVCFKKIGGVFFETGFLQWLKKLVMKATP